MKKRNKHRVALTLLIAGIIFVFIIINIVLSGAISYILAKTGVMVSIDPSALAPDKVVIIMSLNSLVLGAIIAAIASHLPMKTVNKIINQMNRLASGDYKARLEFGKPLNKHPTAIEMCDSFNKMAQELENTEMLRSDFINNFSHEFKTPIVSIAGFAKLLKRGNLTEEQRKEYVDVIEEESVRLAHMATNVLNLTNIENQGILSDVSTFNLSEQIRYCVLLLENKWVSKNLDFVLEFPEITVTAGEELLKQVWINLIDNAVKFTPEYGTVEIKIGEDKDKVTVEVINIGSEIAKENLQKIFNKFYQEDESHASEGNGVGLAIVKKVVELHGGTVSARSGDGVTSFMVELPK